MAVVAESKSERLVYKLYTDPTFNSTTEPVAATDPGASDGQILRHIDQGFVLTADQYRPNEKRDDAQRPMGTSGTRSWAGPINGFLSPGTHKDLFAAAMRSAWQASIAKSEAELTSIAMSASGSTVTFGGGDPVAEGLRAGMVIAATNITGANLAKRFLVLGFSGTSNRVLAVYPPPLEDLTADTAFNIASVGKIITNPASRSAQTQYKVGFEVFNSDTDFSRFYSEGLIGGFDLGAPVNSNVTLNFNVMGRNRTILSGGSAPFFASPAAETTSDIPSSMAGLLRLNGATVGISTALTMTCNLNPQAVKAKNADGLVARITLEDFMLEGSLTALVDGSTFFDAYDNKTEMELFQYYPTSALDAAPSQCFYTPRVRLTSCQEQEVDGAKAVQCNFECARYVGSGAGINSTTLQISDTNVS